MVCEGLMDWEWHNEAVNLSVEGQWNALYNKKMCLNNPSIWRKGNPFKNSAKLVDLLPGVLDDLKIKTFADIGCSDFVWLSKLDWSGIKYTGYDIVERIVDKNKETFPNHDFEHRNLINSECPKVDMVFIRSVFIHSRLADCKKIINRIMKSGSTYLMASTSPDIDFNGDNECLKVVKRNLEIEPFNFPEPLYLIPEMNRNDGINNYMGVWKIERS